MSEPRRSVSQVSVAGNQPERLEWFRNLGFGLFIHWSIDTQLGVDISHSLVGASDDYVERYYDRLPGSFDPLRFAPREWAELAALAGVKYVVFTTKHHNGFCMFHTDVTQYHVGNTPFARDVTREILDAFRAKGIAAGVYFSPDDFAWLWEQGIPIERHTPRVIPANNPDLMKLATDQVSELLGNYGDVDIVFFDGPAEGLREHAWSVKPDVVVTRGAIPTPEQHIPGRPHDGAWESNLTMGTQWTYKPTNEEYKSGRQLIETLIETRAKGGNLLLNIGPRHDGTLPVEQEQLLQEVALWMFVNSESIYSTRPWVITNEGPLWFTCAPDSSTLYVFVTGADRWKWGARRSFLLHSVRATAATEVSVLGQSGRVLEYQPDTDPAPTWSQEPGGLVLEATNTQRLYNDRKWPNAVVIRLTNVEPALVPAQVTTAGVVWDSAAGEAVVTVTLDLLGSSDRIELGVEHQDITGLDSNERPAEWELSQSVTVSTEGAQTTVHIPVRAGHEYAVRASGDAGLLRIRGAELKLTTTGGKRPAATSP